MGCCRCFQVHAVAASLADGTATAPKPIAKFQIGSLAGAGKCDVGCSHQGDYVSVVCPAMRKYAIFARGPNNQYKE